MKGSKWMTDHKPNTSERVSAFVALGTFAGAVVVLLVGSLVNVGAIVTMLVGVIVAIIGAWDTLTRRGPVRFVAAALVLIGLGLLIGGFAWADLSVLRIVAVVALALLSVGAARFALGKDDRRMQSTISSRQSGAPANRPVLIMNLKSGGGKAERFHLVDECTKRGIEPIVLQQGDDLLELAEDAVARGADVLGMAGGDGSQALVASVAARHGLPYVVVPAGTRNHFALDLGLNRDDVVGALDAFADGVEDRVDLATVNGRVFVNNATLGLYAKIVQSPEYRDAKRQTAAAMLPDLLGPDAPGLDLSFTGPDGSRHETADVILVSNNPYELQRFSGRGTRARLDGGVLGVAGATIDDANAAARFITLELAGQVRRYPGWLEWTTPRFEIGANEAVEIGIDGEALTMNPPLVFEALPGALVVRLPRHAAGRSPAARAVHLVSRSTIADLARTMGGIEPTNS
jgi:diacylglycerol kinase family enzyme